MTFLYNIFKTGLFLFFIIGNHTFAQHPIKEPYLNGDFQTALLNCGYHSKYETDSIKTAYLFQALICSESPKMHNKAVQTLSAVYNLEDGLAYLNKNKIFVYKIIQEVYYEAQNITDYKKQTEWFKKISKLFLQDFEFSEKLGTAEFSEYVEDTREINYFSKYRDLVGYIIEYNQDIISPNKKEANRQEKQFLKEILKNAKLDDGSNSVYNEIFNYLMTKYPEDSEIKDIGQSFSDSLGFIFQLPGDPEQAKKNININRISKRLEKYSENNFSSIPDLATSLTKGLNDYEKAYILYRWVTENIKYTADSTSQKSVHAVYKPSKHTGYHVRVTQSAEQVFNTQTAVCEGFADLYTALCRYADLEAETITGYSPSSISVYGGHAWNSVRIDQKWFLTDVTWGGQKYFFSDPISFNQKHWTNEKGKQLLFKPYSYEQFMDNATIFADNKYKTTPDNKEFYSQMVSVKNANDDFTGSMELLKTYREKFGNDFDYYYMKAEVFRKQYDFVPALVCYDSALMIKPKHTGVLLKKSNIFKYKLRYNEAEKYLQKALELRFEDPRVHRSRIELEILQKNFSKAEQIIGSLLNDSPDDIYTQCSKMELLYYEKKYTEAEQLGLYILEQDKTKLSAYYWLIMTCYEYKDFEKADFYLTELGKYFKESDYWYKKMIAYNYSKKGQYEIAYTMLQDIVAKQPLNKYTHENLAHNAFYLGQYEESIRHAQHSIGLCYENSARLYIVLSYIMLDNYEEAESIFKQFYGKPIWQEPQYETYNEFFLVNITKAQNAGIYHPDFEKARKFLTTKNI